MTTNIIRTTAANIDHDMRQAVQAGKFAAGSKGVIELDIGDIGMQGTKKYSYSVSASGHTKVSRLGGESISEFFNKSKEQITNEKSILGLAMRTGLGAKDTSHNTLAHKSAHNILQDNINGNLAIEEAQAGGIARYRGADGKKHYITLDGEKQATSELVRPDHMIKKGAHGATKTLKAMDEDFVKLAMEKDHETTAQDMVESRRRYDALKDLSSVVSALQVSDHGFIAENAGEELGKYCNKNGHSLKLHQFQNICTELQTINNERHVILSDIKPSNMAIKNGVIRHIDTDEAFVPGSTRKLQQCGTTAGYTTSKLADARLENSKLAKYDYEMAKRTDSYAMLISMIECTCGHDLKRDGVYKEGSNFNGFGVSIADHAIGQEWIDQHVNANDRAAVTAFLKDPAANPLPKPLHQMIDWNS